MFAQERHNEIRSLIRARRRMSFEDLQKAIKVSPATLRRDLVAVEKSGDIIRVHGGVLDSSYARAETSFGERLQRYCPAKRAIAAAVAEIIPSGVTVFVDAGSTCLEAGKILLGRKDVRIITHSVPLVEAGVHGSAEVICIGGALRKVSGALTGASGLAALELLRTEWALVGASGLHPAEGCSTTELSEAEMKKMALARADRRVLLADQSKWKCCSTVKFADWSDFDFWVTDHVPPPAELRNQKMKIVSAEKAKK
jgi:DeoR family fructose operon transcriptional repressor